MKIIWETCVAVGLAPVPCTLCGRSYRPQRTRNHQFLLALIYNNQGRFCGEACWDCVQAGSEAIHEHLSHRLQTLQTMVEELQILAQEEIQLPTLEQEFRSHL